MSRLIDADPLLEQMTRRKDYIGRPSDPVCLVEDAPAVDAVPVVRCPDCKHYKSVMCPLSIVEGNYYLPAHNPVFFCADGERRENR